MQGFRPEFDPPTKLRELQDERLSPWPTTNLRHRIFLNFYQFYRTVAVLVPLLMLQTRPAIEYLVVDAFHSFLFAQLDRKSVPYVDTEYLVKVISLRARWW